MIRCPHCEHPDSTVREVKSFDDYNRRYRVCSKCGKKFVTHEVLAVYLSKKRGHMLNLAPVLESDG